MVDKRSDGCQDAAPRDAMQDAISISPAVGFDAYLSGMRMIRIVPKSPLQYDTQYKVAIDAAKLTGRQHKGIAEFRFATPKLRFTYNDSWLQQNDEMTGYVLIGEIVSSDYADGSYMERNLKISDGHRRQMDAFGRRAHTPIHRGQHRPAGR